ALLSGKTCKPCPAMSCRTDHEYIQSSFKASGGDRSKNTRAATPANARIRTAAVDSSSVMRNRPAGLADAERGSGATILSRERPAPQRILRNCRGTPWPLRDQTDTDPIRRDAEGVPWGPFSFARASRADRR